MLRDAYPRKITYKVDGCKRLEESKNLELRAFDINIHSTNTDAAKPGDAPEASFNVFALTKTNSAVISITNH